MKKYFREIDFPNYINCDMEIKSYFNYLYPDKSKLKNFFNFLSKETFVNYCPKTVQGFLDLNLHLKGVFMIVVVKDTNRNIHIDGSPHPCRLQWPVMNIDSVETVWYDARKEDQIREILPNGVPYISYRTQDCREVARKNIRVPTIIRVEEPHAVSTTTEDPSCYPRVAFSFAFAETLEQFLEVSE